MILENEVGVCEYVILVWVNLHVMHEEKVEDLSNEGACRVVFVPPE